MNKQYKTKEGFYAGSHSDRVAALNPNFVPLADDEDVYVTADNEMIVSDVAIKGAALLSQRPSDAHQNINGEWVKPEVNTSTTPTVTELLARIEKLEKGTN